MNKTHLKNITLFGAIGMVLTEPVYHMASSTNQFDFVDFLKKVRAAVLPHMVDVKIHLVLDNHRAHHTNSVKEALIEYGFIT